MSTSTEETIDNHIASRWNNMSFIEQIKDVIEIKRLVDTHYEGLIESLKCCCGGLGWVRNTNNNTTYIFCNDCGNKTREHHTGEYEAVLEWVEKYQMKEE